MGSDLNIRKIKAALRRDVLAARDALPLLARRAASEQIAAQIIALPSFITAQRVLLFHPFGSEWDADIVIVEAFRQGKTVALSRIDGATKTMTLHRVDNIERDTVPGVFGIREPFAGAPRVTPETLDWLLVPGLAFSPHRDRLGYGAGYYDCLLAQIMPKTPRVAGAFDVQIVADLPAEAHDQRVDVLITESEQIGTR
jgi:5,10-methenyltetrahydrofolate synthetase